MCHIYVTSDLKEKSGSNAPVTLFMSILHCSQTHANLKYPYLYGKNPDSNVLLAIERGNSIKILKCTNLHVSRFIYRSNCVTLRSGYSYHASLPCQHRSAGQNPVSICTCPHRGKWRAQLINTATILIESCGPFCVKTNALKDAPACLNGDNQLH